MAIPESNKSIIQCQVKLRLRPAQERMLSRWLWNLTGVYNWASLKIKHDAANGIYHSRYDLEAKLIGHSKRIGIPSVVLRATARTAHGAWARCFKKLSKRPRLKGRRNTLNSIDFMDAFGAVRGRRISLHGIGPVAFHAQDIPAGKIKQVRAVKRASGWHLCLFIQAAPSQIPVTGDRQVGIDPGFKALLALSDGTVIEHQHELQAGAVRLGQAQRGRNRRLTARLHERQSNRRKDRNHKLSRRLVSENALIAWSRDSHRGIARTFGKSVASAAHGQLRQMLAYKCRSGGREFVEVSGRYSTMTCSACGARSGPTGYAGLKVRQWRCSQCGSEHDRDVNAARNSLIAGLGINLERGRQTAPGIAI